MVFINYGYVFHLFVLLMGVHLISYIDLKVEFFKDNLGTTPLCLALCLRYHVSLWATPK